ncbi:MAG: MMPL family transporter [Acidimicrobiales bacterium]
MIASQESLAAFTRAMVTSLPVALVLTMVIVGLSLRSVRFSLVSLMPILVVVVAVWGYMALRGFTINVITATIAAIAVGVGIDFCTHFTVRYRSELAVDSEPLAAVRRAAAGTGGALAVSALTSVLGFAVMALAPAPVFASFGELMAVMILLSAAAALFVLPSLLVLVSPRRTVPAGSPPEYEAWPRSAPARATATLASR